MNLMMKRPVDIIVLCSIIGCALGLMLTSTRKASVESVPSWQDVSSQGVLAEWPAEQIRVRVEIMPFIDSPRPQLYGAFEMMLLNRASQIVKRVPIQLQFSCFSDDKERGQQRCSSNTLWFSKPESTVGSWATRIRRLDSEVPGLSFRVRYATNFEQHTHEMKIEPPGLTRLHADAPTRLIYFAKEQNISMKSSKAGTQIDVQLFRDNEVPIRKSSLLLNSERVVEADTIGLFHLPTSQADADVRILHEPTMAGQVKNIKSGYVFPLLEHGGEEFSIELDVATFVTRKQLELYLELFDTFSIEDSGSRLEHDVDGAYPKCSVSLRFENGHTKTIGQLWHRRSQLLHMEHQLNFGTHVFQGQYNKNKMLLSQFAQGHVGLSVDATSLMLTCDRKAYLSISARDDKQTEQVRYDVLGLQQLPTSGHFHTLPQGHITLDMSSGRALSSKEQGQRVLVQVVDHVEPTTLWCPLGEQPKYLFVPVIESEKPYFILKSDMPMSKLNGDTVIMAGEDVVTTWRWKKTWRETRIPQTSDTGQRLYSRSPDGARHWVKQDVRPHPSAKCRIEERWHGLAPGATREFLFNAKGQSGAFVVVDAYHHHATPSLDIDVVKHTHGKMPRVWRWQASDLYVSQNGRQRVHAYKTFEQVESQYDRTRFYMLLDDDEATKGIRVQNNSSESLWLVAHRLPMAVHAEDAL